MSHDRMAAAPPAQTSGQGASAPTAAVAPVSGDVAAGKLVFRKCQACHSLEPGKNGSVRPCGIFGKKAAAASDYNYSTAMKVRQRCLGRATLDALSADPQKSFRGTRCRSRD